MKKKERLKVLFVGNCDVVMRVSNAVVPDEVSVRNDVPTVPIASVGALPQPPSRGEATQKSLSQQTGKHGALATTWYQ